MNRNGFLLLLDGDSLQMDRGKIRTGIKMHIGTRTQIMVLILVGAAAVLASGIRIGVQTLNALLLVNLNKTLTVIHSKPKYINRTQIIEKQKNLMKGKTFIPSKEHISEINQKRTQKIIYKQK
jgi:uncharacterized membrane protein YobD (UPF0266 family)